MSLASAPALRLHHIGHAVPDVQAAAAGYRTRFGYRIATRPIHDPLQTAVVQFLQLPPDKVYLELVAPDSPSSRLAAVVNRGGGLHHLCFSSVQLEKSIEALSATGMRLIADPVPAIAFGGRRICWLLGSDRSLVELVEASSSLDLCVPGERVPL